MDGNWDGTERRKRSDFEREVISFMSTISEHMKNSERECVIHRGDTQELRTCIHGNGKMGLKTQVNILWMAAGGLWAIILVVVFK